jgi:serine/threonine protein kinase
MSSLPAYLKLDNAIQFTLSDSIPHPYLKLHIITPIDPELIKRSAAYNPDFSQNGSPSPTLIGVHCTAPFDELPLKDKQRYNNEITLMWANRHHKFMQPLLGYSLFPALIFHPTYPHGTVGDFLRGNGLASHWDYGKSVIITIVKQVCQALNVMHTQSITHGRLNPECLFINLITEADGSYKLTVILSDWRAACATPTTTVDHYANLVLVDSAAPEIRPNQPLTNTVAPNRIDVFAVGILMAAIMKRCRAWKTVVNRRQPLSLPAAFIPLLNAAESVDSGLDSGLNE